MLCNLCKGVGNLICFWPLQWWACPKCGGHGATVQHKSAVQTIHAQRAKKNKHTKGLNT